MDPHFKGLAGFTAPEEHVCVTVTRGAGMGKSGTWVGVSVSTVQWTLASRREGGAGSHECRAALTGSEGSDFEATILYPPQT